MIPDIRVTAGEDPLILGGEGDPSGFEMMKYSKRERAEFLDFCQTTIEETYARSHDLLARNAQKSIGIYVRPYSEEQKIRGSAIQRTGDMVEAQAEEVLLGKRPYLRSFRPMISEVKGMALHVHPEEFRNDVVALKRFIVHETIHMLADTVLGFSKSVDEGFVSALEERLLPEINDTASYDNGMYATSGLRLPADFSSEHYILATKTLPYIAGPVSLRFLETEKLWAVCAAVMKKIQNDGYKARFSDFEEGVRTALPKQDASRLLNSTIVKPLEPGLQQFVFPMKKQSAVRFITGIFQQNPSFRFQDEAGSFDTYYGSWSAIPTQKMNCRAIGKKPANTVEMSYESEPDSLLQFAELAKFATIISKEAVQPNDIQRFHVSLGHAKSIDLRPPQ